MRLFVQMCVVKKNDYDYVLTNHKTEESTKPIIENTGAADWGSPPLACLFWGFQGYIRPNTHLFSKMVVSDRVRDD